MQIAVELPEDIAKRLQDAWRDVSRGALEAIAVEGYRDGTLTRDQVGRLLGLSFGETEAFLKQRQAYLAYSEEDFDLRLTRTWRPLPSVNLHFNSLPTGTKYAISDSTFPVTGTTSAFDSGRTVRARRCSGRRSWCLTTTACVL